MIGQFVKSRVYVFVDAENLFYCQRTLGWLISYEKLMAYFKDECGKDAKVFVYKGIDENNPAQRKFLDMLATHGFIVRTKTIKKFKNHEWKYGVGV